MRQNHMFFVVLAHPHQMNRHEESSKTEDFVPIHSIKKFYDIEGWIFGPISPADASLCIYLFSMIFR
jgi:hypothetical protein